MMEHDPQHVADIIERELDIHRAEISRLSAENAELRVKLADKSMWFSKYQGWLDAIARSLDYKLDRTMPFESLPAEVAAIESCLKLAEDLAEAVEKFAEQKPLTVTAFMGKALQAFRASQKGGE